MRLRRNVVLSNLSVTLDPSDVNKCPTYFIVYGVKASEKVVLNSIAVSKGQNVVQLLGQQDKVKLLITYTKGLLTSLVKVTRLVSNPFVNKC